MGPKSIHDPEFDPPGLLSKVDDGTGSLAADSSVEWGLLAMFTWMVPMLGQLAVVVGLVRGFRGFHSPNRLRARFGIVLSIISLILQLALIALFIHILELAALSPSPHR